MTTPQFTIDWPYGWHTRDERDVVIYCTDAPHAWNVCGRFRLDCLSAVDLINRRAPTVSVPVDKLHDGAMFESLALKRAIIAPEESNLKCGSSRPVKWFYADEVEITK